MKKTILGGLILVLSCAPAFAQNAREQARATLIKAFIQKNVVVKLDMPGIDKGVEVFADKQNSTDAGKNLKRLTAFGTAIRSGDTARVTGIRVTKDEISVELNGGGMPKSTFVGAVPRPALTRASTEESRAMNRINSAGDSSKRDMEQEHSRVKYESAERKRKDARATAVYVARHKEAIERARAGAPNMGSRFVIKFDRTDPASVTPDELKRLLADYVVF
jgi:hypothetical protein